MAPITRLAIAAMLFCGALVNALPVLAPIPAGTTPALVISNTAPALVKRGGKATVITKCQTPGTVAITFDDGPSDYTEELLKIMKDKGVKATFFMNGNNYGKIENYAAVVKRARLEGHQVASHTWDHADLTKLSAAAVRLEMTKLEIAFQKIMGDRPTFMRPPYGAYNDGVLAILGELGYRVITWDEDTEDWQHPENAAASTKLYKETLTKATSKNKGHIFLEHDTNKATAVEVAPTAIDWALENGFKVVTVGTCLGVPESQWYRK